MATYRPETEFTIAEPCAANWDEMRGDARRRHCAACSRDVHNLAAMTAREIEALMSGALLRGGPLPCVRMAQFDDGTLLVAPEPRAHMPYGMMAGAMMSALVTISSVAGCAQQPALGRTMGKPAVPQAVYVGQVLGADGKAAPLATVYLSRLTDGKPEQVEVQADVAGRFRLAARPGLWNLYAMTSGAVSTTQALTLQAGEHAVTKPLQLRPVRVTAGAPALSPGATMGVITPVVKPPVKAKP